VTDTDRPGAARAAAVVLAAGSGTRLGAERNKVFLPLAGRPVVSWSLRSFTRVPTIHRLLLVIREADRQLAERTVRQDLDRNVEIVIGGNTRHESEMAALTRLSPAIDDGSISLVLLHDAARPFVTPAMTTALMAEAVRTGAVIPALERDDIRPMNDDGTIRMLPAPTFVAAQTPQVFDARDLWSAYRQADRDGFVGTDTMSCFQHYHPGRGSWLPGDPRNLKITYPDDMIEAERILTAAGRQLD
jgi:2-C-methyl-D-erythritol 4-phosphate cytidylyltransferase